MSKVGKYGATGALIGAGLGAARGYLGEKEGRKKRMLGGALIGAGLGGAIGSGAGAIAGRSSANPPKTESKANPPKTEKKSDPNSDIGPFNPPKDKGLPADRKPRDRRASGMRRLDESIKL